MLRKQPELLSNVITSNRHHTGSKPSNTSLDGHHIMQPQLTMQNKKEGELCMSLFLAPKTQS